MSLEEAFWREFQKLAAQEALPLNKLAERIDEVRGEVGLASAIRVYVLERALAER